MAIGIVDLLKVVYIKEDEAERQVAALGPAELLAQAHETEAPIVAIRQRIQCGGKSQSSGQLHRKRTALAAID